MIYNELLQRGTDDFPFELYLVDAMHPRYEMSLHWHSELELIRVIDGQLTVFLDGRARLLTAGEGVIVNSETVHGASPRDCVYECIVFNLAFLKSGNRACDEFLEDLLSRNVVLKERMDDNAALTHFNRIFEELKARKAGFQFQTLGAFLQLWGELQRKNLYASHLTSHAADEKRTVKLKLVLQYIRKHYASDVSLEDMAAVAGFSCRYFCKFFKETTGTTPVQYLTAYRIERAARLLLTTDLSVTQIAFDCGFNDLSYFIKTFKNAKKVSPKEYRKIA